MNSQELCQHVDEAIARSLRSEAYLDADVLKITGFSTPTMRRMFSNLCHLEGASYLECGCFCGASLISALCNNPITAYGVEDFSQPFANYTVREQLTSNVSRWGASCKKIVMINTDCFTMDRGIFESPIDLYFYDGEHSETSQAKALPYFLNVLNDSFVYIVDDTDWPQVASGVALGFAALKDRVRIDREWKFTDNRPDGPNYHNGISLYVCSKL